jgi:hypothetical protein
MGISFRAYGRTYIANDTIARPKVKISMEMDMNAVRIPGGDRGARSGEKRFRLEVLGCAEGLVFTRIGYWTTRYMRRGDNTLE